MPPTTFPLPVSSSFDNPYLLTPYPSTPAGTSQSKFRGFFLLVLSYWVLYIYSGFWLVATIGTSVVAYCYWISSFFTSWLLNIF